ncbi:DMT family transporter [Leptolyngbya sp. 7M]|uniref:DMT family transporter n=1 Tax=Leptolyngbya sp. 7M TaxID=2812896 RepID=UPI001B8C1C9D|nr:DMT family transporter [Leptolyngbya sp. 7M]QYO66473.1 DMT family transporter [Leptolyngbya sp. 7M]
MSSIYFYILLALIVGTFLPLQVGVNSKLADSVGSPLISAFLSFCVGTIALLSYILITGTPIANAANAKNASPISWIGGLLGAFYVAVSIVLLPKLGVATTVTLIIAGQVLMSLVMDHFGLLDVPIKEVSFARVCGAILVILGVVLIRKY